jgi:hypothetical protein
MKKSFLLIVFCYLVFAVQTKAQTYAFDTLDINNVRAVFNSVGINFSDNYNCFFEVPKGSGQKTISGNILWIGAEDINSSLYLSGGISSSAGKDYYPGPLTVNGTASTDSATMANWNKVWKVTRQEIDYHLNHYGDAGYVCPPDILNWPAHGNPALHQAQLLAPFFDINGDQMYNPTQGDYPCIRGDKALFFIFNDKGGNHYATGGTPMGLEIHCMAYAFDRPFDSALNNTIFVNYKIINRSTYQYHNVKLGIYAGLNINNDHNDYTRSDINRGSFYTYSATNSDPFHGNLFPAQACAILAGPYKDPDGLDNPKFDSLQPFINCGSSINGANFADQIIDNERFGMTGFISFKDTGSLAAINEPSYNSGYFNYLNSKWKDNQSMTYWGNGHPSAGGYGPPCNFIYPNKSDPCVWGTGGVPPGAPFPNSYWTEEQASNVPGNRQGLGCTGPITLYAGAENYLDIAFIYGIDYSQPNNLYGWQTVLNQRIDSIRKYFVYDFSYCGWNISGIEPIHQNGSGSQIILYPNPASATLNIEGLATTAKAEVYDLSGKLLLNKPLTSHQIDISSLATGFYFIKLTTADGSVVKKFVKH